jgi:hypothetical protein
MKKIAMFLGLFLMFLFLTSTVYSQSQGAADNSKKSNTTQAVSDGKDCAHKSCTGKCDPQNKGKNKDCPNFVDKNNDGVCDNFVAGKSCCGNGDMKGKGTCCKGEKKGRGNCCGKETAKPSDNGKSK